MIVGLDLAENVNVLLVRSIFVRDRIGEKAASAGASEDGGVVLVGGEDALGVQRVGVFDHLEQRLVLGLAVDGPRGVKNFVAAVLGVGLGEHHQFDVVRVAAEGGEGGDEVVDLVVGEGEAEVLVGGDEGAAAGGEHRNGVHRARLLLAEERGAGIEITEDGFRHAVVEFGAEGFELGGVEGGKRKGDGGTIELDGVGDHAFEALDGRQAAEARDVGGFGRPR